MSNAGSNNQQNQPQTMSYFYTDANGQRQGPVNNQQLKALVVRGIINPTTPMETDAGQRGIAGQIPRLFEYRYKDASDQERTVNYHQLRALAERGTITPDTLLLETVTQRQVRAEQVPGLKFPPPPPPQPPRRRRFTCCLFSGCFMLFICFCAVALYIPALQAKRSALIRYAKKDLSDIHDYAASEHLDITDDFFGSKDFRQKVEKKVEEYRPQYNRWLEKPQWQYTDKVEKCRQHIENVKKYFRMKKVENYGYWNYAATSDRRFLGTSHGNPEGLVLMGLDCFCGFAFDTDVAQGAALFRSAAEQGNAEAQYYLGMCYEQGRGVPKDSKEAEKWKSKAGSEPAPNLLIILYGDSGNMPDMPPLFGNMERPGPWIPSWYRDK